MTKEAKSKMASIAPTQDIEIELATRPALRLWQGREKTENRHGILGLPGFCSRVVDLTLIIGKDYHSILPIQSYLNY